jgi:ATP-dependent Clp protease, protease subunit
MDEEEEEKQAEKSKDPEFLTRQLFAARSIFIFGPIEQDLAKSVCAQLVALSQASNDPINIYINSPGGHVESGDSIYDFIKFVRPTVRVIGSGCIASAAALIFVSAQKKYRYCLPNSRFMIHQPRGGIGGKYTDIEIQANEIIRMKNRLIETFAKETGQSVEKIRNDAERDFWMNPREAIDYGLAGSVINRISDLK